MAYGLVLHENREVGGLSSPLVNKFSERLSQRAATAWAALFELNINNTKGDCIGKSPFFCESYANGGPLARPH